MDGKITTIVSDLGNVLVRFDHGKACQEFARICPVAEDIVYEKLFRSGLEEEYDLGRISSQEFGRRVNQLFAVDLALEVLRKIWSDIFWPMEGAEPLVDALGKRFTLVLLSNTNEWHFAHCLSAFPFLARFDHYALSYEVGARKPEETIFLRAVEMAGAKPSACLYIDDIAEYVEAARRLGLKAIRFQGMDRLVKELRLLGIFPAS